VLFCNEYGVTKKRRKYEEIVNCLTHMVGLLGAITFSAILITQSSLFGDGWHITSYSIFGGGLILTYLSSTIFHGARNLRKKVYLNRFDHSSIYILIAATYTPVTLVSLRGGFGWVIFGLIWGMAICGIIFKIWFYTVRMRKLSMWVYIAMGWLIIIAIVPIIRKMPDISLWFLLIGSLSYFFGTFFYIRKNIPFGHSIFHLFIMGGSVCHFYAIFYILVP
jgi:hemolysin III